MAAWTSSHVTHTIFPALSWQQSLVGVFWACKMAEIEILNWKPVFVVEKTWAFHRSSSHLKEQTKAQILFLWSENSFCTLFSHYDWHFIPNYFFCSPCQCPTSFIRFLMSFHHIAYCFCFLFCGLFYLCMGGKYCQERLICCDIQLFVAAPHPIQPYLQCGFLTDTLRRSSGGRTHVTCGSEVIRPKETWGGGFASDGEQVDSVTCCAEVTFPSPRGSHKYEHSQQQQPHNRIKHQQGRSESNARRSRLSEMFRN